MWLFFALLAPLLFAVVHVMDSYCVEDIFEKPWMGMVTSAIASTVIFLPLPYLLPILNWGWPAWHIIILAVAAGILIQISQGLYFQAHGYSEAGIVSSYWNIIPVFVAIISYVYLGDILSLSEYIGVIILIAASTQMLLVGKHIKFGLMTLALMTAASFLQAISYVILDVVFAQISFGQAYCLMTVGLILAGIVPLFFSNVRQAFKKNATIINREGKMFLFIEIVNLLALASAEKAIDLHNPTIVSAVETTMPAFTFAISILLLASTGKYGDVRSRINLHKKIFAVALMCVGVFLIS